MRIQTRALTSPSCQHRHIEAQLVIRRIADRPARIEVASRRAADIAAGAEAARQFGATGCRCPPCDPAATRSCRRAPPAPESARESRRSARGCAQRHRQADRPRRRPARCSPSSGDGRSSAAAQRSTRSRSMPQCASMMLNDASLQIAPKSPRWLAIRSSSAITPRSQMRARRRLDAERRLHRAREGECIGDRAVARRAAGKPRGLLQRGAVHQVVDALVHVAQALFQPHHRFAIGGEAEMARLDDAGVHRTDGDLVQAFAFDRQERIGGRVARRGRARDAYRAGRSGSGRTDRARRAPGEWPAACRAPTEG